MAGLSYPKLFDADLTLADKAPTLEFMDNGSKVQIDRGESISFEVMAFDYPDQNWTIETAVFPRRIDIIKCLSYS